MCAHVCSGGCTFDEKYANVLAAGGAAMALVNEEIGLFALPSTGRFDPPKTPAGDTALTAGVMEHNANSDRFQRWADMILSAAD